MLDRNLLIVTGKGGVGKSAVATALALLAQRTGLRVLLVSMTSGEGVAAHLGTGPLRHQALEVRPGLSAAVVDRARALTEYLQVQLGVPRLASLGPLSRAFDALASTAPGIREVITVGKVLWEARREEWDLVVADGPPIGQIGSHLRAAKTVGELVPTGRIRGQAAWMTELLADPARAALVMVTTAEELPVIETLEALVWLEEEKPITVLPPLINRVLEPLEVTAGELATLPEGPHRSAAELHQALWSEQQEWLARLPDGPHLPLLFGVLTPAEVAAQLADALEAV